MRPGVEITWATAFRCCIQALGTVDGVPLVDSEFIW
jgi:hypothetical protein